MPSLQEQILARAVDVIAAAGTAAEDRVDRHRTDTPAVDETPNVNVRRTSDALEPFADDIDAMGLEFVVEHWASGADWETQSDALHLEVHAALMADAAMRPLVRSLRCIGTDVTSAAAEVPLGRIAATYRAQALVSQRDLTRHFNT
jgi:hypothetical protein